VSDSFRDLEQPDSAHRKDAVLMATISGLEYLDRPTRQDMARFSKLFLPLFDAASGPTRRTASAALSRLPRVPDDVAQMLINQPIDIAAPFIAQYAGLKESALARAVARMGAPHARAAARRSDLSPQAISALRALDDPSVEGLLVLRGLVPDPAKQAAIKPPAPSPRVESAERRTVETPPLDPSEKLRENLARNGASRSRAESTAQPAGEFPKQACSPAPLPASRLPPPAGPPQRPPSADWPKHGLGQLARYAKPDHESWFATALADAMETSYALAERIMMDLSRPATGNRPDRPECPLQHHQSRA
jgi:uncharacterized protein (DUF2336 family)